MKFFKLIFLFLISLNSHAQTPVGTGFNYQGKLADNGAPANGSYDMEFTLFDTEINQIPLLIPNVTVFDVNVINGLFTIPTIDFDFIPYYQGNEVWMEVAVKKSSDSSGFEVLTTRQKIAAVPYSFKSETSDFSTISGDLLANGANSDDVLAYDGTGWKAKAPGWSEQNNILSTANESYQVSIGTPLAVSEARLTVSTNEDGIVTKYIGSGEMHNVYLEGNTPIGYVGSLQDGTNAGTLAEDFEIGTSLTNASGNMHLTTQEVPRLTVASSGKVGINNTIPNATLDINIDINDNTKPVRIVKGGEIFGIHTNTGISIGDATVPPPSGLYSRGDVKQDLQSNGLVKFMLTFMCGGPSSSIYKQYNGVSENILTVEPGSSDGFCRVNFPTSVNINDRYFVYSTISGNTGLPVCTTNSNPTNILFCSIKLGTTYRNTGLNILVY